MQGGSGLASAGIDAPRAGTRCRDIEEDEAEQDGGFTTIQDGVEILRRVSVEIRDGHFTRQKFFYRFKIFCRHWRWHGIHVIAFIQC